MTTNHSQSFHGDNTRSDGVDGGEDVHVEFQTNIEKKQSRLALMSESVDTASLLGSAASKKLPKKVQLSMSLMMALFVCLFTSMKLWLAFWIEEALRPGAQPQWTFVFLPFWIFLGLFVLQLMITIILANYINIIYNKTKMGTAMCVMITLVPVIVTAGALAVSILPLLTFLLHLDGNVVNSENIRAVLIFFAALVALAGFVIFVVSWAQGVSRAKNGGFKRCFCAPFIGILRAGGLFAIAVSLGFYGTLVANAVDEAQFNATSTILPYQPPSGWVIYLFVPNVALLAGAGAVFLGLVSKAIDTTQRSSSAKAAATAAQGVPICFLGAMIGAFIFLVCMFADGDLVSTYIVVAPLFVESGLSFLAGFISVILAALGKTSNEALASITEPQRGRDEDEDQDNDAANAIV